MTDEELIAKELARYERNRARGRKSAETRAENQGHLRPGRTFHDQLRDAELMMNGEY